MKSNGSTPPALPPKHPFELEMNRYQRSERLRTTGKIKENEVWVTSRGDVSKCIAYAASLLEEKSFDDIIIRGMGTAINKTVLIAELLKRRISGLHLNTSIESARISEVLEPLEEGLLPLETSRLISVINITMSKNALDTSSAGYQPPKPIDQAKPVAGYDDGGTSTGVFYRCEYSGWHDERGRDCSGEDIREPCGHDGVEPAEIPSRGNGRVKEIKRKRPWRWSRRVGE